MTTCPRHQLAQRYPAPIYSTSYTPRDYSAGRATAPDLLRIALTAWTWPVAALAWPIIWSAR
jgi:hypothetical protein